MTHQPGSAKSTLPLIALLLAGLGLLLGCSLLRGSSAPATQNAPVNLSQTETAVAQAFAADLVAGQTAVAIANATVIAANETATAQAILQTPPAEYAVVEVAPAPTANAASPPEFTPTPVRVEVPADSQLTEQDTFAQLDIEHPASLSPGSSNIVNAFIYRLPEMVSQTGQFEIVEYPPDRPLLYGPTAIPDFTVPVRQQMRLELSSTGKAFTIEPLTPLIQAVNLQPGASPTVWSWTIVAPTAPNIYILTLSMYRGDVSVPIVKPVYVQVEAATSTPTPVIPATTTPIPTFTATLAPVTLATATPPPSIISTLLDTLDRRGMVAFITTLGAVFAALITSLVSLFVGRDILPIIGAKAGFQRTLKTLYSNLAQLEHRAAQHGPLDVPLKLQNEIDATKQQIAEVEAKLAKLESQ